MTDPAHLLPSGATGAERALSQATARLADLSPMCREMWAPDTCPAAHLPWLAWALSVDAWNADWPDASKRAVIAASYTVHRHKGTVGAVKTALSTLDWEARLVEWHQTTPPGAPYTFAVEITLDRRGFAASLYDDVEQLVQASKNLRSHLTRISVVHRQHAAVRVAGAVIAAEVGRVLPYQPRTLRSTAYLSPAMAMVVRETVALYPQGH